MFFSWEAFLKVELHTFPLFIYAVYDTDDEDDEDDEMIAVQWWGLVFVDSGMCVCSVVFITEM